MEDVEASQTDRLMHEIWPKDITNLAQSKLIEGIKQKTVAFQALLRSDVFNQWVGRGREVHIPGESFYSKVSMVLTTPGKTSSTIMAQASASLPMPQ